MKRIEVMYGGPDVCLYGFWIFTLEQESLVLRYG
jgi:hypothetical protein